MNSAHRLDRKALMSKLLPAPEIIFTSIERATAVDSSPMTARRRTEQNWHLQYRLLKNAFNRTIKSMQYSFFRSPLCPASAPTI